MSSDWGMSEEAEEATGPPAMAASSASEIKHALRQRGETLKDFAKRNNFAYRTVSEVVRGVRLGLYGEGRLVREALGLPTD
jgi:gp16 family phage-associated protein